MKAAVPSAASPSTSILQHSGRSQPPFSKKSLSSFQVLKTSSPRARITLPIAGANRKGVTSLATASLCESEMMFPPLHSPNPVPWIPDQGLTDLPQPRTSGTGATLGHSRTPPRPRTAAPGSRAGQSLHYAASSTCWESSGDSPRRGHLAGCRGGEEEGGSHGGGALCVRPPLNLPAARRDRPCVCAGDGDRAVAASSTASSSTGRALPLL